MQTLTDCDVVYLRTLRKVATPGEWEVSITSTSIRATSVTHMVQGCVKTVFHKNHNGKGALHADFKDVSCAVEMVNKMPLALNTIETMVNLLRKQCQANGLCTFSTAMCENCKERHAFLQVYEGLPPQETADAD